MFLADFKAINNKLVERIAGKCLAKELRSKGELDMAVNTLTETIQEVLNEEVLLTKPCPYMKWWWTKELSDLKKMKNMLSRISHHFRGTPDHPSHTKHKNAAHNLRNCIDTTKKKHWVDWLEDTKFKDIYTANRYINGEPTDYSNAHIPDLKTHNNGTHSTSLATDNATKAKVLVETFFPPPPPQCHPYLPRSTWNSSRPGGTSLEATYRMPSKGLSQIKLQG